MRRQFQTRAEVDAYLAHERIECLECGRRFAFLGVHLQRIHEMSAAEYRAAWGLPAKTPLAGTEYRAARREEMRRMQIDGTITYDHLQQLNAAGRTVPYTPKSPMDARRQAAMVAELRPGDQHRLPPGSRRADGRDADRARKYQQTRRAQIKRETDA